MKQIEKLIRQAVALFEEGQTERAEIAFRKILKQFPNHHLAIGCLADFYMQVERPDLALPLLRRLVVLRPNDYISHFLLGVAYSKMVRCSHSLEELKKALALRPNDPEIMRQMGITLGLKGELKEARKILSQVVDLHPGLVEAYADLAANYMFNCEYTKAEKYLEKAQEIDPEHPIVKQVLKDLKHNQIEFQKMSKSQQEKRIQEVQSEKYKKQMRIELMMYNLSQMEATAEDLAEIEVEFKEMGLSGQITAVKNPDSPEGRAATEYVEWHKKIKNIDTQKLSPEEIKQNVNKLLDKETPIKEQKDLILILAHQGSKEALDGLKEYAKNPPEELKFWAKMAVDECKSFLAKDILEEPVIHFSNLSETEEDGGEEDELDKEIKNILG